MITNTATPVVSWRWPFIYANNSHHQSQVDFQRVEARLSSVKDTTTWIQVDVTDGVLVKPASFPLELLNRSDLILEKIFSTFI